MEVLIGLKEFLLVFVKVIRYLPMMDTSSSIKFKKMAILLTSDLFSKL